MIRSNPPPTPDFHSSLPRRISPLSSGTTFGLSTPYQSLDALIDESHRAPLRVGVSSLPITGSIRTTDVLTARSLPTWLSLCQQRFT